MSLRATGWRIRAAVNYVCQLLRGSNCSLKGNGWPHNVFADLVINYRTLAYYWCSQINLRLIIIWKGTAVSASWVRQIRRLYCLTGDLYKTFMIFLHALSTAGMSTTTTGQESSTCWSLTIRRWRRKRNRTNRTVTLNIVGGVSAERLAQSEARVYLSQQCRSGPPT